MNTVGKMILNDFQRGKLPYFVPPPPKVKLPIDKKGTKSTGASVFAGFFDLFILKGKLF